MYIYIYAFTDSQAAFFVSSCFCVDRIVWKADDVGHDEVVYARASVKFQGQRFGVF